MQKEIKLKETGQSTMFDLFGESAPVPMPSLEMKESDVSVKDKAAWEKELLGVPLSKQPFAAYRRDPNTVLCGQVDEEMAGQTVTVIGEVTMVITSFTREHKTFATVSMEDISGRLEVMVWPNVYEKTLDYWQEGNILEIKGRVRMRDERVQFVCDGARPYNQETAPVETPAPVLEKHNGVAAASASPTKQHLVVNLRQTENVDQDLADLNRLIGIFKEYPGQDEVSLRVINGTTITRLKLPAQFINYSPELHRRLADIVGESGLSLE